MKVAARTAAVVMAAAMTTAATVTFTASAWAQVRPLPQAPPDAAQLLAPHQLDIVRSFGPWPPPPAQDPGNAYSGHPQAIALGQRLFFDRRLSADGSMSCASCHAPARAFTDGRARSLGHQGQSLTRNAPTLWNAVHERWMGWDGAADSLWHQAIRPIIDPTEMASTAPHVARLLAGDAQLACRYRTTFAHEPLDDPQRALVNAGKALGAFTATLVSARTRFDAFRDAVASGDTAAQRRYPAAALRGLSLFTGRGQCHVCHFGPMFSNGEFADIGLPFFSRPGVVDPGRHGGIQALRASAYNLLSPHSDARDDPATTTKTRQVEPQHRNFGEFKVPSLRNVSVTAPYMHDGQLRTLRDVVRHYSELNEERLHADGERILKPLRLSPREVDDLLAFLGTLADPQARAWRAQAMPPCPAPGAAGAGGARPRAAHAAGATAAR